MFDYRIFNINTSKTLSSGESSLLNFFSTFYNFTIKSNNHLRNKKQYLLLLDEPDHNFHPQWKRKFIKSVTDFLPVIFSELNKKPKIQIIFTTHNPLTLSDIPQNNIIYLDKDKLTEKTIVINKKAESFGANVHNLLADSFFLQGGFMGEFAQELITDLINYLTYDKTKKESKENLSSFGKWTKSKAFKVINIVDEPFIKERLTSLYNKKFLYKDKQLLRQQISQLQIQLNKIEDEEN